ncbi:hypothetical protein D3C87_82640 [compost metagenome]
MSKLRKLANFAEDMGPGYENSYGQVTPYHILFKDFGNNIAELPKDQSVQFCISKIKELNEKHGDDPQYMEMSDEELNNLKETLLSGDNDSGMDVLFAIKDKLLETEGVDDNQPNEMEEVPQPQELETTEPVVDQQVEPEEKSASVSFKRLIKNK